MKELLFRVQLEALITKREDLLTWRLFSTEPKYLEDIGIRLGDLVEEINKLAAEIKAEILANTQQQQQPPVAIASPIYGCPVPTKTEFLDGYGAELQLKKVERLLDRIDKL